MTQKSTPIFLTKQWMGAFSQYLLAKPSNCFVVEASTNNSFLPFYFTGNGNIHSLTNYYSPYYQNFGSSRDDNLELGTLVKEKKFSKLTLVPISPEVVDSLKKQLAHSKYYIEKYYYTRNWRHLSIKSFDDFKAHCSSNIIKSTERYRRKLSRTEGFQIEILRNQFSKQIFKDYQKVYERSWKKKEASFDFLRIVYSEAQALGQLRIGFVYYQQQPVAVQVWFSANTEAYVFKLAYDESFASYRVGNVLFLEMAKSLIEEDKVETIDFLTGNDKYKSKWMTECRDLYGVIIYNRHSFTGFFGYLVSELRNKLKSLIPSSFFD